MSIQANLQKLTERWRNADPGERSNAQLFLTELAEALDVPRPQPKGSGYEFELPVRVVHRDGAESVEFADLYREGHFLLEAKDEARDKSSDVLMRAAYGQARSYVTHIPGPPPPYILVLDVARTLIVWDRWSGTYGGFQAGRRVDLETIAERDGDIALLRDIWLDPQARDPRAKANAVTKEIAGHLAELAASLEKRGHDQEVVARFLIRCVFTMFAEDVGLLKEEPFLRAVRDYGLEDPEEFSRAVGDLWAAMDTGGRFGLARILHFDGHFFHDQTVLPVTREDLGVLLEAARADWAYVEPSIFGTLLTRALDPEERHRLGAQFTPREFVERLVRPTIEDPIRKRWTRVEAEVIQLVETGRDRNKREAQRRLNEFHTWLRSLRFLDPACGSGNFLYVSLATVKRIEAEVLRTLEELTGQSELHVEEVGPWQFHGIEVKPWAREIAELTLWIGYHQFWLAHHGHSRPPEPVLRDTGTFECRDAVLTWDAVEEKAGRPDPTPKLVHSVTGELVPDPEASLTYMRYEGGLPAPWPEADFIVGNPPYMGNKRMREAFGDGYVEALRAAYPSVPESADYVMYWWQRAAQEVASGRTLRAGLITTRSIADVQNRALLNSAEKDGAAVIWAIPDHPWVDEAGAADVWVAMTVIAKPTGTATRIEVDGNGNVIRESYGERLNSDLSLKVNIPAAVDQPLLANAGLSGRGVTLVGSGFILEEEEATAIVQSNPKAAEVLRRYWRGSDITRRPRRVWVIDFGMREEAEAREYPVLFDLVRTRVYPERRSNNRASYRKYWWRFGEPRGTFRQALHGLSRYIATTYVAKHRLFRFVDGDITPDGGLIAIGMDEAWVLGVLSSSIHSTWSVAAGGTQGVGHTPRYNNSLCFEPFPMPDPAADVRRAVSEVAETIEAHRDRALARMEKVTLTEVYNVVEKLSRSIPLDEGERVIHEETACGVLLDLHDELDRLVAHSYGWPWPLEEREVLSRLIALHDSRKAEESSGRVRWLRPQYQRPRFADRLSEIPAELELAKVAEEKAEYQARPPWPDTAAEQIQAVQEAVADTPGNVEEIASRFHNARRELVDRHLETLKIMGEVRQTEDGRYHAVMGPPEAYAVA